MLHSTFESKLADKFVRDQQCAHKISTKMNTKEKFNIV